MFAPKGTRKLRVKALSGTLDQLQSKDATLVKWLKSYIPLGANYNLDVIVDAMSLSATCLFPHADPNDRDTWFQTRENVGTHCSAKDLHNKCQILVEPFYWDTLKKGMNIE